MGELQPFAGNEIESRSLLSKGITPEVLLAIALISPDREKAISTYIERMEARQQQRADEFELEVLKAADLSPEELLQRLLDDDAAGQLFGQAVMKAIQTADQLKRHALARAVASGLLSKDEAMLDIANMCTRTINALEAAHFRVLLELWELQLAEQQRVRKTNKESHSEYLRSMLKEGAEDPSFEERLLEAIAKIERPHIEFLELEGRLQWSGGALRPLMAELAHRDLILGWGSAPGGLGVSPFGERIIEFLQTNEETG